jgi:hypothetical protein
LSSLVTNDELEEGRVYPNLNRIQAVELQIAIDVGRYALEKGLCHLHPMPEAIDELIKSKVYKPEYTDSIRPKWH